MDLQISLNFVFLIKSQQTRKFALFITQSPSIKGGTLTTFAETEHMLLEPWIWGWKTTQAQTWAIRLSSPRSDFTLSGLCDKDVSEFILTNIQRRLLGKVRGGAGFSASSGTALVSPSQWEEELKETHLLHLWIDHLVGIMSRIQQLWVSGHHSIQYFNYGAYYVQNYSAYCHYFPNTIGEYRYSLLEKCMTCDVRTPIDWWTK
jgi:hypothetical protein